MEPEDRAAFVWYVIHYQGKIYSEYSVTSALSVSLLTPCQLNLSTTRRLSSTDDKKVYRKPSKARTKSTTKMVSNSGNAHAILAQLQAVGSAYAEQKPGAREQLLSLSNALIAALELPSEAIQRIGWAEVSLLPRLPC